MMFQPPIRFRYVAETSHGKLLHLAPEVVNVHCPKVSRDNHCTDDLSLSPESTIILYSQPYCPACRRAKEFLSQHNVQFDELDVSVDYDARDDLWEVHGSQNTPTLVIDGEAFIGFRREAWAKRLGLEAKP